MTVDGGARLATFSSYVPQAVVRHLASEPAASGSPHAEDLPAALLFVDITGFTAITAAAVGRGAEGTELLSRSLNAYLAQIIELVTAHGGDVAKIVGDALIPIWPAIDEDLPTAARRAAACGLAIAHHIDELELEGGRRLSVKVGLCAGEVALTHVGGMGGKWHFLIAGAGVSQLSAVGQQMQTGALVASPQAWSLVATHFVSEPLDGGHVRIRSTQQDLSPRPLAQAGLDVEHQESLRAYIPDVTLARLDAGQAAWLAELRRTTVVFINVRGVGHATPGALAVLQRLTAAAQRSVTRYDGWLKEMTTDDKGTTVVAVFGVPPFSHEDDPSRAIRAALAIQAEIGEIGLSAGAGVATGPAFCGPVGTVTRRDFVVLGEHVNLAARLMQASGADGVLCDTSTREHAHGSEAFERLPAYVLKGMTVPIEVNRVRAAEVVAERPLDLIDRTDELSRASAALAALGQGQGDLLLLEGEPGIGKSRVIREIARRARAAHIRIAIGLAAEIESATPYHAWRAIFERLLGLDAVADRASRSEIVLDRLGASQERSKLAPLLDPILSLDLPDTDVTSQLSGAVRADNTRDLLIALLQDEASRGPLMLVLEDAHWLDSASWMLVERIRRQVPSLLVILTSRPVGDAEVEAGRVGDMDSTVLRLGPLAPDDVVALACQRTGASALADGVAAVVHERAEGNPLFIEQLTYAMRDAGRIVVDDGVCQVAPGTEDLRSSIIPDTIQRVITTRIDQLPPPEAMTLKVASVIGQRFALRTLRDIYPIAADAPLLAAHLETLSRLDLMAAAPSAAEPTFEFRHVITKEVAYNLMLSEQSQDLHRRLAEWYERTYAADLAPFHAFLAHHWRRAGDPARAIEHLERAGAQALRTFANEEAIGFFAQAVSLDTEAELGIEPARRARWQLQLGEAHVHMSRYREGRHHLESGLQLMRNPAPASRWQQGAWLIGELLRQSLRRAKLVRGTRSLSDAEREKLVIICRAYERLAEASYYRHETMLPLYCVIRILNEAEASGSPAEIARGFAGTGALLGVVPLPRIAEWYLRRALGRLEHVDDLTTHEIVGIVVGFYYTGAARWEPAREQFKAVRRIARRLGDRRRHDDAISNLMELEYLQGNLRTALDLAGELTTSAMARNDRRFEADALAAGAYCWWQLGHTHRALENMDALRALMSGETDLTDELKLKYFGILGMIHASNGESSEALAASEGAMRLTSKLRPSYYGTFLGFLGPAEVYLSLRESGQQVRNPRGLAADALDRLRRFARVFPVGLPRYRLLEGRKAWLDDRHDDAFRAWRGGLAQAEALDMPYEQAIAHLEIGRHLGEGDPARSTHLTTGREILGRIGATRGGATS